MKTHYCYFFSYKIYSFAACFIKSTIIANKMQFLAIVFFVNNCNNLFLTDLVDPRIFTNEDMAIRKDNREVL